MHPILGDRARLGLYLLAWLPVAGLLVMLAVVTGAFAWGEALALLVPLTLGLAVLCLSSFYLCRAVPLGAAEPLRLLATHGVAASVVSALWILLGTALAHVLSLLGLFPGLEVRFPAVVPPLAAVGMLFFLLVGAVHYLLIAFETSRQAETRALEARVLSKEAELKALRAQLQPHFLFNSLNSISALTTADPERARRMCLLLAEFLRRSLRLGAQASIPLSEELELIERFLAIEKVRFGDRLSVVLEVEEAARDCRLPPLLLQPLVENAVAHGIAGLVDGGALRLAARRWGSRLLITVENPRDPDGARRSGEGVGIENVRRRLDAAFGREGRLEVKPEPGRFRVELLLPLPVEPD